MSPFAFSILEYPWGRRSLAHPITYVPFSIVLPKPLALESFDMIVRSSSFFEKWPSLVKLDILSSLGYECGLF